jgi:Sulfotransferase domain
MSKLAKRAALTWTRATSQRRPMPDYLIIGAQRSGTTSLDSYLRRHPAVVPAPLTKEVHYFDRNFHLGEGWYRAHFPTRAALQRRQRRAGLPHLPLTGEATPYYVFHPHAPQRIARLLPHAKLIVLLRDPVARAWSHYHHEVALGFEPLSFEEAIDAEDDRLGGEHERMLANPGYSSFVHRHHSYLARGRYVEQLPAWQELFPPEQLLVVQSELLFADPDGQFARVQRFLGLPVVSLPDYPRRGQHRQGREGSRTRWGPKEATRRRLADYFAPHNKALYELLDTDFGWNVEGPDRQADNPHPA